MPYLHWARLHDHNRGTKERHRDWVKNCKKPSVHPRRSLDEAALQHLSYNSLMERNCDQVVTRFLQDTKQGRKGQRSSNGRGAEDREKVKYKDEPTIMVVDQLWLWILDDGKWPFFLLVRPQLLIETCLHQTPSSQVSQSLLEINFPTNAIDPVGASTFISNVLPVGGSLVLEKNITPGVSPFVSSIEAIPSSAIIT